MKDIIKRLLIIILFWLFAGYLIYCMIIKQPLVLQEYKEGNIIGYIILIIISSYIAIFYGIFPVDIKFSRSTLLVLGFAAIIIGKTILTNDGQSGLYFWDLSCIFWVILLIIGPTNLIITKKVKKKSEDKNLEIIEI